MSFFLAFFFFKSFNVVFFRNIFLNETRELNFNIKHVYIFLTFFFDPDIFFIVGLLIHENFHSQ